MRLSSARWLLLSSLICFIPTVILAQKKFCSATLKGSNYFYVGMDNWLDIQSNYTGEAGDSLIVRSDSTFIRLTPTVLNRYNVRAERSGKFNIRVQTSQDTAEFEFIARPFPNPVARIAGVYNASSVMPEQFQIQKTLLATMKPEAPDMLCIVASFDLTCIRHDNNARTTIKNQGAMFNSQTRALVTTASTGDIFLFENIQSRCACDNQEMKRTLDSVVVRIE